MCNILFSFLCFIFLCATFRGSLQNTTDVDYVHAIATKLLELPPGSDIPPLIVDLLRSLPQDVKDILKDKPLYELSKDQMATLPVPLLYLLPSTELYDLSGYQHAMLVRSRPAVLSLADLVVNSMEDSDVKGPFLRSLQKSRNLSAPVLDALGRTIAGWKSAQIEFEVMYDAGDPLALHLPLPFMVNLNSKLRGEMMFYLRTWLWSDLPYRGANINRWFQQPWSVRRLFTRLCLQDNYPAPLGEWKYNHVEGFSHLLPTMTLDEFSQINLKERFMVKALLKAPLNTLQIRYLFESIYTTEPLYYVEFQEFAHFLSALQPQHLNRFLVNGTDMMHTKYHLNNMTFATAKQIREIIKVQIRWSGDASESLSPAERMKQELSNLGPLLYTEAAGQLAKLDPSQVDVKLLATLDSSKLTFPQAYELRSRKDNISLASPLYQVLPQALPALPLQEIEPGSLAYDDLLHLLRLYPGTQAAFTATLMDRLRSNLVIGHLEQILQNPHRNQLLRFLPVPEDPAHVYALLSQLYEQPMYRGLIDQVDSSLVRTIMPAQVSHQMYSQDQFLFKGVTCAHINNINTYELVVFAQDYFSYMKSTGLSSVTKQSLVCWFARVHKYLHEKATLPLLDKIDGNALPDDGGNRIDLLTRHELRAFGNAVIMFKAEEIAGSKHLEEVVRMMGETPREFLDVMKSGEDYGLVLRRYFEKSLNATDTITMEELLTLGNLTHHIPPELIPKIDPRGFRVLVETKLVDTRVCGGGEWRRQMEELIVRAFGHVSTWTPDILLLLKDFLLTLSEEQLHQIPTKSWTSMADLIGTSYQEPAVNEHGVWGPFYRMCMTRMNNEKESQDYLKSVSALIQFYLVKIQLHLNTIKTADEIIKQQVAMSANKPIAMKPTTIDDDEMNTLLILEPDIDSHEFEDDTSTASTTTEGATEDSLSDNYNAVENNVKTKESEFNFWDVFKNPKNESNQETTTVSVVQQESILTMAKPEKEVSSTSSENRLPQDSMEKYDASDEDFFKSSEEENPLHTSSEEIIEVDDSISKRSRNNENKVPCEGECMAMFESKNKRNDTDVQIVSENEVSTTLEPEKGTVIDTRSNKYPDDVDQNKTISCIEDEAKQKQKATASTTESLEKLYTTIGTQVITVQNPDDNSFYEKTTLPINQEHTTTKEITKHTEEYNPRENTLEYEQNKDVIANDLNKWNQNHEEEQNKIKTEEISTTVLPENIRRKKENRFENFIETTHIPTTEFMLNNAEEQTTQSVDKENLLISEMPSVTNEDPMHANQEDETNRTTNMSNENIFDDGYIVNPNDSEILERKITETENTTNEITEETNTERENIGITATTEYNDASTIIPTEQLPSITDAEVNIPNKHIVNTDNNDVLKEMTTNKITSNDDTKSEEREVNRSNSSEVTVNSEEINKEENINKLDNSNLDPNQHQNKLTDELSTFQPIYKPENTNDQFFNDINTNNKDNEKDGSIIKENTNNYPSDHFEGSESDDKYFNKSKDEVKSPTEDPFLFNNYPTETVGSSKSDEQDQDSNRYDSDQNENLSKESQMENIEKQFRSEDKSNELVIESDVSGEKTEKSVAVDEEQNKEINSIHEEDHSVKKHMLTENETQTETAMTPSVTNPSFGDRVVSAENHEINTTEREINIHTSQPFMNEENNDEIKATIEDNKNENPEILSESYSNFKESDISIENTERSGTTERTTISQEITSFTESNTEMISTESKIQNEETSTKDMTSIKALTEEAHQDNNDALENHKITAQSQSEELKEKENRIYDQSVERDANAIGTDDLNKEWRQKSAEEITTESKSNNSGIENISDSSYLNSITESIQNRFEESSGERSNLLSISGAEETTKTNAFIPTPEIPSNYKHADFKPLKLKIDHHQNMIGSDGKTEMNRDFRRVNKDFEEFVVYDLPDDVTPQDIEHEDPDGDSHTQSRNNKSFHDSSEDTSADLPEVDVSHSDFRNKFLELNRGIQDLNKNFDLDILDVTDERTRLKKRSIRRRRFIMNDDTDWNPTNVNFTCEALSLLGTITDVINIENIIVKLNKESLLDCLDLINNQQVSKRTKEDIINKYYNNLDEVLPLLGNTLADLTLEEIRGLNMNVWSLEILDHMNAINDTNKAEIIVEKYLKKVNRNMLNLNEMVILNNMLCYLPENLLRKSLRNMKSTHLLNIVKHINTCSPKCLSTFSSLVLEVLGSPMHWKYEQVYHLGTAPSGLNETMWNEFILQKHLKFNMNENNYKCLSKEKVSSINIAVLEEYRRNDDSGLQGVSQDYSSGSITISGGTVSLLINLYVIQFFVNRVL